MARDLPTARRHARCISLSLTPATLVAVAGAVQSHEPQFECINTGALKVTCGGTLAEGHSASGLNVRVYDKNGEVLFTGKLDGNGRFTFKKPDAEYHVAIDLAGGESVTVFGSQQT